MLPYLKLIKTFDCGCRTKNAVLDLGMKAFMNKQWTEKKYQQIMGLQPVRLREAVGSVGLCLVWSVYLWVSVVHGQGVCSSTASRITFWFIFCWNPDWCIEIHDITFFQLSTAHFKPARRAQQQNKNTDISCVKWPKLCVHVEAHCCQ